MLHVPVRASFLVFPDSFPQTYPATTRKGRQGRKKIIIQQHGVQNVGGGEEEEQRTAYGKEASPIEQEQTMNSVGVNKACRHLQQQARVAVVAFPPIEVPS